MTNLTVTIVYISSLSYASYADADYAKSMVNVFRANMTSTRFSERF